MNYKMSHTFKVNIDNITKIEEVRFNERIRDFQLIANKLKIYFETLDEMVGTLKKDIVQYLRAQ